MSSNKPVDASGSSVTRSDAIIGWIAIGLFLMAAALLVLPYVPGSGFGPTVTMTETTQEVNGAITRTTSTQYLPGKSFWDLLQLLIIPAVLAGGAYWLNARARDREFRVAEQRRQYEEQIADDRLKEATLQTYLDQMTDLLLKYNQGDLDTSSPFRLIAHVRTITALRRLDGKRNGIILNFLMQSGLLGTQGAIGLLGDAEISGADFRKANLDRLILTDKNLNDANFAEASLQMSGFIRCSFIQANLRSSVLSGSNFREADLTSADLSYAKAIMTKFDNVRLIGADLSHADLHRARFSSADLTGANLSGANLSGVDLPGANLTDVNFAYTDLVFCHLSEATVTDMQLSKANSLYGTTMPDGSVYDGRFNLWGDIERARKDGVNMSNSAEMKKWYLGEASRDKS